MNDFDVTAAKMFIEDCAGFKSATKKPSISSLTERGLVIAGKTIPIYTKAFTTIDLSAYGNFAGFCDFVFKVDDFIEVFPDSPLGALVSAYRSKGADREAAKKFVLKYSPFDNKTRLITETMSLYELFLYTAVMAVTGEPFGKGPFCPLDEAGNEIFPGQHISMQFWNAAWAKMMFESGDVRILPQMEGAPFVSHTDWYKNIDAYGRKCIKQQLTVDERTLADNLKEAHVNKTVVEKAAGSFRMIVKFDTEKLEQSAMVGYAHIINDMLTDPRFKVGCEGATLALYFNYPDGIEVDAFDYCQQMANKVYTAFNTLRTTVFYLKRDYFECADAD